MDQTLLERVNPVFNTAKMTVFQLAKSGDQYDSGTYQQRRYRTIRTGTLL